VAGIIQTDSVTCAIKVPPILRAVRELGPDKPVIFAGLDEGAAMPSDYITQLRELGIPYFPSTERALRALKRLTDHAGRDFAAAETAGIDTRDMALLGGINPEYHAKRVLAPLGIAFPKGEFAKTLAQATIAAEAIGYPVVLKAQSPDLSHKSDAGGVVLGLANAAELAEGWQILHDNVHFHRPGLMLDGVLIEQMGARGVELIIGARNDPQWGPVLLVGFGGITAEIHQDVRLLAPDLPIAAIEREINLLKGAPLLTGFRGAAPLDVAAAAQLLAILGRLLLAEPSIREIDLNPVIVHPAGKGVVALDALILADTQERAG